MSGEPEWRVASGDSDSEWRLVATDAGEWRGVWRLGVATARRVAASAGLVVASRDSRVAVSGEWQVASGDSEWRVVVTDAGEWRA